MSVISAENRIGKFTMGDVALIFSESYLCITISIMTGYFLFFIIYCGGILLVVRLFEESDSCSFDYGPLLIISASEFSGLFLITFSIDSMGRVWSMQMGICICVIGLVGLVFNSSLSTVWLTLFAFILFMGYSIVMTTLWVIAPELYPTEMRATSSGLCICVGMIGASVVSYWSDSDSLSFSVIAIGLAVVGVVFIIVISFLPETAQKPMTET